MRYVFLRYVFTFFFISDNHEHNPFPSASLRDLPGLGEDGEFRHERCFKLVCAKSPYILAPHQRRHLPDNPDHPEISNLTKMGRADAGLTPNTEADSNHLI